MDSLIFFKIQQNCSVIIQNGWKLDFNLSLSAFEENILATRELVDIASVATHTVKFVFISSIAAACCDPVALSEASSDELTGYGESKYVAEQVGSPLLPSHSISYLPIGYSEEWFDIFMFEIRPVVRRKVYRSLVPSRVVSTCCEVRFEVGTLTRYTWSESLLFEVAQGTNVFCRR